jgi:CAAX protease family protein
VDLDKKHRLFEFFTFLIIFFIIWSLRATYFYFIDDAFASDFIRLVYSNALKFILWLIPAFAFTYWIRHTSPLKYLGITIWPEPRELFTCISLIVLFLCVVITFEVSIGNKTLSIPDVSIYLSISALLFHIVSPFIEEILFRGLILRELLSFLNRLKANILTSILFVGIHLPFWLFHDGLSNVLIANCIGVFIISLLAGWLYIRTKSIWPPTLAHIANNFLATLLV